MACLALRRLARCAALAALVGASVGSAHAQEADRLEQANAAFSRGLALESTASFAEALAQFQAAAALAGREAPQTELHIGRCQSKLGLLADARSHLVHAVELAHASGARHVEQAAREELDQVMPRVPTLTLLKPSRASVKRITIDERAVPTSALGTPLALNAVEHRVVVEFEAGPPLQRTVALREGANESMSLEPPESAPTEAPTAPAPASAARPVSAPPNEVPAGGGAYEAPASHGRVLGWALVGAGGAAAVAGTIFWVLRGNEISTLDAGCPGRVSCPSSLQSDFDRGKLYDGLGIALFATAGVAAAAGGGVLLFGGGKNGAAASVRVFPQLAAGGAGATMRGTF